MKKLLKTGFCILLTFILSVSVLTVYAEDEYIDPFVDGIGEIELPKGTPEIDGTINPGEGWSSPVHADKTNTDGAWNGEEVRVEFDLYRAWDENGLYFAADIAIPEFIYSTGFDDINDKTPGWNGDVFIISLDPLRELLDYGMGNEATPWYCIGLFEGNVARMYRTQTNAAEITENVKLAGSRTDAGWKFETFIPWDIIISDIDSASFGDVKLTSEQILKNGNLITASMIYQDRCFDPEAGCNITYSRYVTISKVLPDGGDGTISSAWCLKAHGIFFKISGASQDVEIVTDDGGNAVTDIQGNKVTGSASTPSTTNSDNSGKTGTSANKESAKSGASTTKSQGTSAKSGGTSAQTFDMGIAVSVGALAISVIGIVATKKKKR